MAGKKKEVAVNVGAITEVENGDVIKVDTEEGSFHVEVDTSIEDVIKCVEEGKEIIFDAEDLPSFSEEEVRGLPYGVAKDFFKALDIKKSYEKRKNPLSVSIIGNILGGNSLSRLESLRARVGWHQTWKRDDELDEALAAGYVQIREKGSPDEKVGQESGPVIQIKRDGKVELIAMEIRQEIVDRHGKAVAEKSQSAYKNMKEDFREKVEEINISVGGTKKDPTILVVDKEGEDD